MSRVVVLNHVTLDGVMQGPGRADEDNRDSFDRAGWAMPDNDDVMGQAMGAHMERSAGLLLGRRSYEDMLTYWNSVPDSPFADALNDAPKYVASRTLRGPLALAQLDVADRRGGGCGGRNSSVDEATTCTSWAGER